MTTYAIRKTAVLLACLFTLAGCKTPTTSAERHAKHFTYAADDGFDPHFVTRKHDSIKLSVPFFKQFWEEGKRIGKTALHEKKQTNEHNIFTAMIFLLLLKTTVYSPARNTAQPIHH